MDLFVIASVVFQAENFPPKKKVELEQESGNWNNTWNSSWNNHWNNREKEEQELQLEP